MCGLEFKFADAPRLTPLMRNALADLSLERLLVINPGTDSWPLAPSIDVIPLRELSI